MVSISTITTREVCASYTQTESNDSICKYQRVYCSVMMEYSHKLPILTSKVDEGSGHTHHDDEVLIRGKSKKITIVTV